MPVPEDTKLQIRHHRPLIVALVLVVAWLVETPLIPAIANSISKRSEALYNSQGIRKLHRGDYKAAISDFDKAITASTTSRAEYYHNRGLAKQRQGDLKAAVIDFNNGSVIKLNDGDFKGAMAYCSEAIKLDPNYSLPYHNRGLARQKLGDEKGAIEDFRLADQKLHPNAKGDFGSNSLKFVPGEGTTKVRY